MKSCLSAPLEVFIAVTNRCNLFCDHCNVSTSLNSRDELTTEQWVSFIQRLAELKVFTLWISGGEPFLREDLFTIIGEVEKHHFSYGINTNATAIDEDAARRLAGLKRLTEVVVSLDGSNPSIHEKLRGKGSFARAVTGIENLVKHNIDVSTYTTVTGYNIDNVEDIVLLGKSLGLAYCKFNEMLPLGNALCHLPNLTLTNAQRRELTERMKGIRAIHGNFVTGMILEMGEFFDRFTGEACSGEVNGLFGCGGGIQKCTVRPDGWVVPCDRLWNLKAGNVLSEDFQDIWKRSPVFLDMRMRSSVSLDTMELCQGCRHKSLCVGGCPAVTFELYGTVFAVDPLSCFRIYQGGGYPYPVGRGGAENVQDRL
ncbi:MAG TPA: radical SAM protein [Syntrophales bacterium]|nr:radical SAM protein [Syntrophales bacterium]